ncbi:ATP-dependent Clp protease proteolytic subunit [Lederbergia citrisecunda]|uniref:ClpP family protease n=1 Tax=Lederbergia citrisecunda TaxID=2833583 RepID=UPI003D2DAA1F
MSEANEHVKSEGIETTTEKTTEDREIVEVYLDDLEALLKDIDELENDEDITTKIDRVLTSERVIYLQGIIDKESISSVVAMIHYYNLEDDKNDISPEDRKNIKIYISSEGGEIIWCKKLLAAIENSKCKIETISEGGQIASAGFIIFLAGDIRKLSRHSEPLYHNLSAGFEGTYSEMKTQMAYYDKTQREMDEYIISRTSIPMKRLKKYRERNLDWHMTFEECKKYKVFDIEI